MKNTDILGNPRYSLVFLHCKNQKIIQATTFGSNGWTQYILVHYLAVGNG